MHPAKSWSSLCLSVHERRPAAGGSTLANLRKGNQSPARRPLVQLCPRCNHAKALPFMHLGDNLPIRAHNPRLPGVAFKEVALAVLPRRRGNLADTLSLIGIAIAPEVEA